MNTFAQRLAFARNKKGINQTELARLIHRRIGRCSPQAVQKWESDLPKATIPRDDALEAIVLELGFSKPWFLFGDDNEIESQPPQEWSAVARNHLIPIKGRGQLGDGGFWEPIENDGYIRWYSDDPDAYVIQGIGDSMTPRVRHKEYVVVEPNKSVMSGDEVFVVTANGRQMVKIFLYGRDGRIYLESVNEEHEKIILDAKDLLTMHYVSGIAKPSSRI